MNAQPPPDEQSPDQPPPTQRLPEDPSATSYQPATGTPASGSGPGAVTEPAAPFTAYPTEAAEREGAAQAYAPPATGPVGKVRSTGTCILLYIVTLGIYGLYWWYAVHKEMKEHSNQGIGGGIALILAIFIGIVMPYLTSNEVGDLYRHEGKEARVSAVTGLWYFPGIFIIVGPIIWFVKTNAALNDYWTSHGAQPS